MASQATDEKSAGVVGVDTTPANDSSESESRKPKPADSREAPTTEPVPNSTSGVAGEEHPTVSTTLPEQTSSAVVLSQPAPTPQLTVAHTPKVDGKPSYDDLEAQTMKKQRYKGPRRPVTPLVRALVLIGTLIKILFFYVIPGAFFVVTTLVLGIGLPFAVITAQCAATEVIGNLVLKAAGHSGYSSSAHAAMIGAAGGAIAGLCLGLVLQCVPNACLQPKVVFYGDSQTSMQYPWYITFASCTLLSTLAGVIGCAILLNNNADIGGYDVLHAARAAAVGGIIYAMAMVVIGPVIITVLGTLLSPIFMAMAFGLKWVHIRANNSWEKKGNWTYEKYSHCYCYGFCERDDEIDAELSKHGL